MGPSQPHISVLLECGRRALPIVGLSIGIIVVVMVQPAAFRQEPAPVFRSATSIVSVDAIVRDQNGAIVRGLSIDDFTVEEDGKRQQIVTFSFQELADTAPAPSFDTTPVLADLDERVRDELQRAATVGSATTAAGTIPMPSSVFAGRRMLVLLFDVSSMQPEDVQRAVDAAGDYLENQFSPTDLVSVVAVGTQIQVLTDFTNSRADLTAALARLGYTEGTAASPPEASTAASDEAAASSDTSAADDTGFDAFNNDFRLRALKATADALAPIEQKKAILYFSAGMQRSGDDNQVELRAAINAAIRGNVAIYPVDARGLQAVAPGGDASRGSRGGVGLFSGQAVRQQFDQLTASQDTLTTLAADTGGLAFTDSNDFGEAFQQARRDLSAYYLIGYASTNLTKDGRFRRIRIRVARRNVRVDARNGYFADRDFAHTSGRDREALLDDQLSAPVSSTDLPVLMGTGWFRSKGDRFYVPVALALAGSSLPVMSSGTSIDVRGLVRDEAGRTVGRIRDTIDVPRTDSASLSGRIVLYQSGVTLPSGRYWVKVVVRENTNGAIGSFEAPVTIPILRGNELKVSPPVMSTQLQPVTRNNSANPLVRDGVQLLPNLTRVVQRNQKLYFYYEVYDPTLSNSAPELRTSLAFYRGRTKVYETPQVDRRMLDDTARGAALFQFELPANTLSPGTYSVQINVVDVIGKKAAFPRLTLAVR